MFLHGELEEEFFMKFHLGFSHPSDNQVCRLQKSFYSLKHATQQWFHKLSTTLLSDGFKQSKYDYSLFTKSTSSYFIALLVYVDEIILASNSSASISALKAWLDSCFKLKDLGPLKFFIGLEATLLLMTFLFAKGNILWWSLLMLGC